VAGQFCEGPVSCESTVRKMPYSQNILRLMGAPVGIAERVGGAYGCWGDTETAGRGWSEPPLPSIYAITTRRGVFAAASLQMAGPVTYRTTKSRGLLTRTAQKYIKNLRFQYANGPLGIMRQ
jgi:hypothetical protein